MKKKILVVDDNRMILKFLDNLLTAEGHEVKTREDGLSALNLLATYKPDIMFVDLIIPKIGGDRLCQIIRTMEHMKQCYLVIISAAIAEMGLNFKEIGVNACIAKGPFGQMGKHVLAAVKESDDPSKFHDKEGILGASAVDGVPVYARRMTRELLGRNRHLETILESMNEGILEIYTDRVVYANSAALALFGTSLGNLLSSRFTDLFDSTLQARMDALLHPSAGSPSAVGVNTAIEFNRRQIVIRSFPVKDDADTTILLITDVTAQRELEYQLQHVQRMDAIGNLSGGIAHNFNNLLMGIQGNVSILIQDKNPGDPGYEELSGIERCIDSGAKLTRQLLSFARGGHYAMARIDINDVVEKSASMFSKTRREINVLTQLAHTGLLVEADASQIELALMDLYVNAWHAMSNGGILTLSTATVTLDDNFVKPHHLQPGVYQKIQVTDNGAGMDEKTAERIFDPFYTTRPMGEGTGLGLASVFGIIKKHSGIITVESQLGRGTTFSIYLPEATKKASPVSPMVADTVTTSVLSRNDAAPELKKGSGTVLVVDDEEYILTADRAMLMELGYDVLLASGGKEGMAIFQANKDRIILVIVDLIMPDMGGDLLCAHIKSVCPETRVILSSGYNIGGEAGMVLKESGDGFIQKPYNLKQLAEKIRAVLSDS